jgi:GNAT superfamily N-acetyltransferase
MLGVVPDMRRRGLGRALLAESYQRFQQHGWSHARLATIVGQRSSDLGFFQSAHLEPIYVNQTYVKPVH